MSDASSSFCCRPQLLSAAASSATPATRDRKRGRREIILIEKQKHATGNPEQPTSTPTCHGQKHLPHVQRSRGGSAQAFLWSTQFSSISTESEAGTRRVLMYGGRAKGQCCEQVVLAERVRSEKRKSVFQVFLQRASTPPGDLELLLGAGLRRGLPPPASGANKPIIASTAT